MGEVVPFRQKPKPDFTEDVPPCDAAFCCPDCMGFAWALRADGCCVLMATHVMQEVTHLCEDVIVIAKGQTVAQGSPDELCRRTGIANLEDAFVHLVGTEEGIA